MPSGRLKGPEKSRSTVREACAGFLMSGTTGVTCCGCAEEEWLVRPSIVGDGRNGRDLVGRRRLPRVGVFVEVYLRRKHDAGNTGHINAVCAGGGQTAAKVYADPGPRLDAGFGVGDAWFDCKRRHPNGSMGITRGFVPVKASYDETALRGCPVVRLRTSTE
eukprot:6187308-Pleurochrysis_carterae.AAC.4